MMRAARPHALLRASMLLARRAPVVSVARPTASLRASARGDERGKRTFASSAMVRAAAEFTGMSEQGLTESQRSRNAEYPHELYDALSAGRWIGICMPESLGGAGLGISEATVMLQTIAESGGAIAGAQSIHANIYPLMPIIEFASAEQHAVWLPKMIDGRIRSCFGITEPTTGSETPQAQDESGAQGRQVYHQRQQDLDFVGAGRFARRTARAHLGTVGHFALLGAESVLRPAAESAQYAAECRQGGAGQGGGDAEDRQDGREYGGCQRGPIGAMQAVQQPLARSWAELEAAKHLTYAAASMYDDRAADSGAQANAAKYMAAEAGFRACETAVMTLGGMGYAREYHVERYLRESLVPRLAPVSREMILNYLGQHVLGLPKSY
ncbi:hypothetical protein L1887_50564 [Cichorium endivia]|nr:hypothetical protein L1887_50564 [Cichorium endivia]